VEQEVKEVEERAERTKKKLFKKREVMVKFIKGGKNYGKDFKK
jgi:hypothetical protein